MAKVRLVLADDHKLFREGVRLLLEAQGDFEVVGEAASGEDAFRLTRELRPEVVVMDISMPGDGIEATRRIRKEMPEVKVLIVTMHSGDDYFFRALEAGASGYVLKEGAPEDLVGALRIVASGQVFLYPSLAGRLVEDYLVRAREGVERSELDKLSAREKEVLGLVGQGMTSDEIAGKLHLSVHTVHTHRAHIMEKLGLQNRAQLIQYAFRMGFLRPSREERAPS